MMQYHHTFIHSPDGLKMIKRQTIVSKGDPNSYRPSQQQASRHRAGHHAGLHPEDAPFLTGNQRTQTGVPKASRARRPQAPTYYDNSLPEEEDIDGEGDVWPSQAVRSAIRHTAPGQYIQGDTQVNIKHAPPPRVKPQAAIPRRSSKRDYIEEEEDESQDFDELETQRPLRTRPKIRIHWLVFAGIAILLMIAGWIAFTDLGALWQTHQDDSTYGNPRTYQTDAVVGHGDSNSNPSHYIALNLKGEILVIELPGGNVTKARSYPITTLPGNQGNPPVKLVFQDLNHDGRLDMLIQIGDPPNTITFMLFNNGTQFVGKL